MGNDEESPKSLKSEKTTPSPPVVDQPNIQAYRDWAAMQAYYGPRVAMPQFFNSAVVSSEHTPHPFMWGPPPQPMMPLPPYGVPYAAIYAHGGIYGHAHPGGVPVVQTADAENPTKTSNNPEQDLVKKMKGFDGLAMSIGNSNADSSGDAGANRIESHSTETDGSSDGGSSGNTAGARRNINKKRTREGTPTTDGDGKIEVHKSEVPVGAETGTVGGDGSKLAIRNVQQPCAIMASETWLQNEKELKRERRKQSNRESARRSRLRKQAEAEELSKRVETLLSENTCLKSELNRLREKSEKLKLENTALSEKLKGGILEQKSKPGVKLRQLLVDAVAGG